MPFWTDYASRYSLTQPQHYRRILLSFDGSLPKNYSLSAKGLVNLPWNVGAFARA
jgi:hypothetical protein